MLTLGMRTAPFARVLCFQHVHGDHAGVPSTSVTTHACMLLLNAVQLDAHDVRSCFNHLSSMEVRHEMHSCLLSRTPAAAVQSALLVSEHFMQ